MARTIEEIANEDGTELESRWNRLTSDASPLSRASFTEYIHIVVQTVLSLPEYKNRVNYLESLLRSYKRETIGFDKVNSPNMANPR